MELTHTRLLVDNYKDCFLFYKDVLGFEISWGDENSGYADFKFNSGASLGIFTRKQMAEAVGVEYSADITKVDRTALIFKVSSVEKNIKN
ncbi:hypothetical protein [Fictibacillus sp. FJAT-27399]|uniref:hypothetical protein n=1 Tax=Fictibacillus sp. FJAT-27399 TaxID=1729689 RepID=UPI000B2B6D8E|nr:hypothetical protein [Fictibacillus sp. FJAT-27399]